MFLKFSDKGTTNNSSYQKKQHVMLYELSSIVCNKLYN